MRSLSLPSQPLFRLGIINAFVVIALLRLTNVNFYLSQLLGFEVEINNAGGNAVNFSNYLGAALFFIVAYSKLIDLKARWSTAWPIYTMLLIYGLNAVLAPYINYTWLSYQFLFLGIALVVHLYVQYVEPDFLYRFSRVGEFIFWGGLILILFCLLQILSQHSIGYFLSEYNEVYVQTLDDFGIMKQRLGYFMGFLVSYTLFIIRSWKWKMATLLIIILLGFGTRSFVIGLLGASCVYYVKRPWLFIFLFLALGAVSYQYFLPFFQDLIYDTRYYSFINGLDIVSKFPFGVGLGGYAIYTEIFSRQLFGDFYDVNAVLDYIPLAPESDIVYVFGSLGLILGSIHLLLQIRIVYKFYQIKNALNAFEKCILYYFTFMTFFGISEDSMFSINYWIFFGLSTGIIAKTLYQINQQKTGI